MHLVFSTGCTGRYTVCVICTSALEKTEDTQVSARTICGLFSNPQSVMLFHVGHMRSARSQQLFCDQHQRTQR